MAEPSLDATSLAPVARDVLARRQVPGATYRVQLNQGFTFADATRLVPYWHALGISHLYTSPYLRARPGSAHGYDVCNHGELNPEIGSTEEYDAFVAELHRFGMGQIVDAVPNHMGIGGSGNAWWVDVLENGPSSPYATYFDIDWRPLRAGADVENRVLLPILGDPYGKALEQQQLTLTYEDGAFSVRYFDHLLPLDPGTYAAVLGHILPELETCLGAADERLIELRSIMTAVGHLPPRTATEPEQVAERQREKEVIKRRLATLCATSSAIREAIAAALAVFNGVPEDRRSFDRLDALLDRQAYRLAFWRVAAEGINYRRFFDVNELAAVREELPWVFRDTHRLILQLIGEGKVDGLRIDHPDGLWDPADYLWRLQRAAFVQRARLHAAVGGIDPVTLDGELANWFDQERLRRGDAGGPRPIFVVVEKILSPGEELPLDWPTDGTTGYDFLNNVNGLFVDATGRRAIDDLYRSFVGIKFDYRGLVSSSKKMIMLVALASEVNELSYRLKRFAQRHRWYRDLTLNSLAFGIREVIAALPVYRTYLNSRRAAVDSRDRAAVEAAVAEARRRNPQTAAELFDFLRGVLLLELEPVDEDGRDEMRQFVMKFQQATGPIMARGLEDTAFYTYNRLVSLNEVGGDPQRFGTPVGTFHRQNAARLQRHPHSLLATSTHDTKRSEDVRARIDVLSEMPREWKAALARWSKLNRRKKGRVHGQAAPDPNEEYLLYQTLLGAWPIEPLDGPGRQLFVARIQAYMLKAMREAKLRTSWFNPNAEWEAAVERFVQRILDPDDSRAFLDDFEPFQRTIAQYGMLGSLAQVLLKVASPGVPDFYQGNEIWDFSLVDPDNRRPVDYDRRRAILERILAERARPDADHVELARSCLASWQDGAVKCLVTAVGLAARRCRPALFAEGAYAPLDAAGSREEHLCAFARVLDDAVLAVVPRLCYRLTGGNGLPLGESVWAATRIVLPESEAGRSYRNLFTGEVLCAGAADGRPTLAAAAVLASFPVALLERIPWRDELSTDSGSGLNGMGARRAPNRAANVSEPFPGVPEPTVPVCVPGEGHRTEPRTEASPSPACRSRPSAGERLTHVRGSESPRAAASAPSRLRVRVFMGGFAARSAVQGLVEPGRCSAAAQRDRRRRDALDGQGGHRRPCRGASADGGTGPRGARASSGHRDRRRRRGGLAGGDVGQAQRSARFPDHGFLVCWFPVSGWRSQNQKPETPNLRSYTLMSFTTVS
ncbi:MAG: malto-oligosyltrehalose synthase [Chloroflexi bacterium]|nr:malto-oligosyltrehalose synthase [Chloroflexota bacterium]